MTLHPEHLSVVLRAIRHIPDELRDDAFKYVCDRIRPIIQIGGDTVREICADAIDKYGWKTLLPETMQARPGPSGGRGK